MLPAAALLHYQLHLRQSVRGVICSGSSSRCLDRNTQIVFLLIYMYIGEVRVGVHKISPIIFMGKDCTCTYPHASYNSGSHIYRRDFVRGGGGVGGWGGMQNLSYRYGNWIKIVYPFVSVPQGFLLSTAQTFLHLFRRFCSWGPLCNQYRD